MKRQLKIKNADSDKFKKQIEEQKKIQDTVTDEDFTMIQNLEFLPNFLINLKR